MCGLAVLIDPGLDEHAGKSRCQAAVSSMLYRGPDQTSLFCRSPLFMGHCRLAVIDPLASRQPMADPSGRYVLVYNGATYNFRQLRSDLGKRWRFVSEGDTEVVLAGLVLEGTAFIEKMVGMWAGAFWDGKKQRLLLFRDRLGQKPLYYHSQGNLLAAASELGALRTLVKSTWQRDNDSLADFFRYGYCLPGATFYREVKEVLPGHLCWWEPGRKIEQHSYWKLPVRESAGIRNNHAGRLRAQLTDAVINRLVADVPVGLLLSGGVDSSLVASICSRNGTKLPAFTMGFPDVHFDERPFAATTAKLYCSRQLESVFPNDPGRAFITNAIGKVGQPFGDPSLLALSWLARLAAGHVKVVLCGDGGDELFGGYQRYRAQVFLRWFMRLPPSLRRNLGLLVRKLPEPMAHHSRSLLKKAHLFIDMAEKQGTGEPYVAPRLFSEKELAGLLPDLWTCGHRPPGLDHTSNNLDDLERMLAADMLVYLPQDILCKADRACMGYGLEARAPFLDHRLVELAFKWPASVHAGAMGGKRVLRRVFKESLPDFVWRRNKQGFFLPLHGWFSEGWMGKSLERMQQHRFGPLNPAFVSQLLDQHRKGIRDRSLQLWAIWSFVNWR